MIDKSDEVFDRVMSHVMSQFPSLTEENFSSDYVNAPPEFPFITIVQTNTITYANTQDDLLEEHTAQLTYDVEVYSNRTDGKKAECRAITNEIDKYMHRMNFTRESSGFVPNLANNSIARLVSIYSVLASNTHFYRR